MSVTPFNYRLPFFNFQFSIPSLPQTNFPGFKIPFGSLQLQITIFQFPIFNSVFSSNKLPRVQNSLRIQRLLNRLMHFARLFGQRLCPPGLLGQSDPMFARNRAAPAQNLVEKFVQRRPAAALCARLIEIDHDIRVNVSISGMAKTSDLQTMLLLQMIRKIEQLFEPPARHNNVFIELRQTRVPQGV